MSVMEQALREIDARRASDSPSGAPQDTTAALLNLPLQTPAPSRLRAWPWLIAVALVVGGVGGWVMSDRLGQWSPEVAGSTRDISEAMPVPTGGLTGEDWLVQAGHVWTAGLHDEAARLWVQGLRALAPSRLALLVGDHQELSAARELHRRWAGQWPLVVLPRPGMAEPRWLVLALPPAGTIDRARQELAQATGQPAMWATVAEWISPLAVLPAPADAAQADASVVKPTEPAPKAPPVITPAPAVVPPVASAQAPAPAPAPAAPPAASPAPAPRGAARAPAATAPTPPAAPANTAPATPRTAARPAEDAPVVVRQSGAEPTDAQRSAAAAQSIDNAFLAVERQLSGGDHAGALEAAQRLEQNVGQTWRTLYLRGVALSGLARWPEAVTALAQAHQRNPAHLRVGIYLAVAMQENGDHGPALEVLNRLTERHPDAPEPWLNKGHSWQAQGRRAEAAQAYQRFLALSTQRPDLQAQRSWVQNRWGKDATRDQ